MPAATSSTNTTNNATRASTEPKSSTNTSPSNTSTRSTETSAKNNNTSDELDADDEELLKQYLKNGNRLPKNADGSDNNETKPLTQEEIDEQVKK